MRQESPVFVIIGEDELDQYIEDEIVEKELGTCDIIMMVMFIVIFAMMLPLMMAVLNSIEYGYSFWVTFVGYLVLEIGIFVCVSMCVCMDFF